MIVKAKDDFRPNISIPKLFAADEQGPNQANAANIGKRLGEAKYLEESLKLARFMHLIIKVPSDAAAFPIEYAVFILDGIEGFCIAKNVNPTINLEKTFAQLGTYQLNAVPVVTVIDIVRRTLKQYTSVL